MKTVVVVLALLAPGSYAASSLPAPPESLAKRLAPSAMAERSLDTPDSRQQGIPSRLAHPLADLPEISARIRSRVQHCEQCHSTAMAHQNGYLPVLRGQQREYLYSKIRSFKMLKDSRHPFPRYSQSLDDEEIVDIALYFALQPSALSLRLLRLEPAWRKEAEEIDHSIAACLECHGGDGNGAGLIPALSGQNPKYLSYRMREISDYGSRIHVYSDAPVSCEIKPLSVRQSRLMAARFALVLDESRLARGQSVYRRWCQSCHDDASHAPRLDAGFDWQARLSMGLMDYAQESARRPLLVHERNIDARLSLHQWTDVLHYLLAEVSIPN